MVQPQDGRGLVQKGGEMTLAEALVELEQAAIEQGDNTVLDGELLDLAVLALALQCPELWRESYRSPAEGA
jgi:hypothetical protein